jgi:hypothetical protein
MKTTEEEIGETVEFESNNHGRVEIMRTELRETILIKRKEDRIFVWNKNRTNLGNYLGNEVFSAEYINERTKLLKKKQISLEDYKYLPNALIQVYFANIINYFKSNIKIYIFKIVCSKYGDQLKNRK